MRVIFTIMDTYDKETPVKDYNSAFLQSDTVTTSPKRISKPKYSQRVNVNSLDEISDHDRIFWNTLIMEQQNIQRTIRLSKRWFEYLFLNRTSTEHCRWLKEQ
ncbi:MAG: hypothetical protein K0R29_1703 [Pseudobdellovibrio sp.]|nr:hypothetical protein [Pseudobdellovibrio sp.]